MLRPHGHWKGGRFLDQSNETRAERMPENALAAGAERFMSAARSPLQARCVQLARMGCVVFHYDMLAEADSVQFLSHKISPRDETNSLEREQWGFASPAAASAAPDIVWIADLEQCAGGGFCKWVARQSIRAGSV